MQENDVRQLLNRNAFGDDFQFGVASSAYQIEGACNTHGKGPSIWDVFTRVRKNILNGESGNNACDFYNRFRDDLMLMRSMSIQHYRFSVSWPRVLPEGKGTINWKGLDFYDRLVDTCLELDIKPWITLYHWDLPQTLERKGGWTNRDVVGWFTDYAQLCARRLGDRVNRWMVLNEPLVFTGAGYFLGVHAPGRKGLRNFLPAMHHAALCQAEGARAVKSVAPYAQVGTTFSCSHVDPVKQLPHHQRAARKVDALLNRLFLEPALGHGYPVGDLPFLRRVEKYMQPGDAHRMAFDFDFIGVQNYTREVVKYSIFTPMLRAALVKADERNVPHTLMNWEIYPEAIYHILKKFGAYKNVRKLIVTENGAAFPDELENGRVKDVQRTRFIQDYLAQVLRAKNEGAPVEGYFVWTFTDNFEWAEGYAPRFGLVHMDFANQERTVKDSGYWYSSFLRNDPNPSFSGEDLEVALRSFR